MSIFKEVDKLKRKIARAEALLREIREDFATLSGNVRAMVLEADATSPQPLPTQEELRKEFEDLFSQFESGKVEQIAATLTSRSKSYLSDFCAANSLPVDMSRNSKEQVVSAILQWLAQRKVITQKAK